MENQDVWRTMSNEIIGGYFVWEVIEVVGGDPYREGSPFFQGADGKWYLLGIFHFFSEEKAREALAHSFDYACQTIHIV